MNGAQALMRTLVDAGVTTCFTNPGTSEMHFVAALDSEPDMRAVLALFEGVATGAADGYARMAERPAATLLHLGCGLGNGLANLHNARKAKVPMINIVGDHATHHVQYDTQLQSDIETVARNVSTWVRTSQSAQELGRDAAEGIQAACGSPGQVATLILPADVSWNDGAEPGTPLPAATPQAAPAEAIARVAAALTGGKKTALLLGGRALRADALMVATQIAGATGATVLSEVFPTRWERGAGVPEVQRLAYLAEFAAMQLDGLEHLVLLDAKAPVSFFAYPGKESYLVPDACELHELVTAADDLHATLTALADAVNAREIEPSVAQPSRPEKPTGPLTADTVCQAIGAALPEGAIIADESNTSGLSLGAHTAGAPRHDVLTLTGGAIGQGLPVAVGAAVACPERPVFALEGDGSAMYTIQSLWTMARENLDVTVIIFNNRSYAILNLELQRVGAGAAGPKARAQLDLADTHLDFVHIGEGFGVPSVRVDTGEELNAALDRAITEPGPHLIEVVVPPLAL